MITVISGTNRKESETEKVAQMIAENLTRVGKEEVRFLSLVGLGEGLIHEDMYAEEGQSKQVAELQNRYILPAQKLWFVFPEYNGGIPGILKLFIDAVSVRDLEESFYGKKACLTGVSTGRAGNLRGMDHLSNILNYLQVTVLPNRVPISSIAKLKDQDGILNDPLTIDVLQKQAKELLDF